MTKTVSFPVELEHMVLKLARENRRSFSAQVVYMVERSLDSKAGQARELAETIAQAGAEQAAEA